MSPELALTLRAELGEVARARPSITAFLEQNGVSGDAADLVHLTFEEIVTNVARHGFPEGTSGEVLFRLSARGSSLLLEFEDRGIPFDPTAHPTPEPPPSLRKSRVGGQGLHLIRDLTQEFTYRREGDTNHVRVRIGNHPRADRGR